MPRNEQRSACYVAFAMSSAQADLELELLSLRPSLDGATASITARTTEPSGSYIDRRRIRGLWSDPRASATTRTSSTTSPRTNTWSSGQDR